MGLQAPGSVAPVYACATLEMQDVVWLRKHSCMTKMPATQHTAVNDASALSVVAMPAQLSVTHADCMLTMMLYSAMNVLTTAAAAAGLSCTPLHPYAKYIVKYGVESVCVVVQLRLVQQPLPLQGPARCQLAARLRSSRQQRTRRMMQQR